MDKVIYSRSQNNEGHWETADVHLRRVGKLCGTFLQPIGYENWGLILGELHDLGKYGDLFQSVLLHLRTGVDHSSPGAAIISRWYKKAGALPASVAACHHSKLSFIQSRALERVLRGEGPRKSSEGLEYSLFGVNEFNEALNRWQADFTPRRLEPPPPDFGKGMDFCIAEMLFARFLFSALIDADWSSAAEHENPPYLSENTGSHLDPRLAFERLNNLLEQKRKSSTGTSELNCLRDSLFQNCLEAAGDEPGLFTLTAPTGLGKTLSMLAFALEHCQQHQKRRVILALPYLSILEQNGADYTKVIPELIQLHSNAEIPGNARELAHRWAAPCILTTNVGFLEPLFSDRPAELRHLHQIADSVILFDEAQSLPSELLDATLKTIKLLCSQYRCTVVLSTATQPSFEFRPALDWHPREIVRDKEMLYAATRRVQYDWRVDRSDPYSFESLAVELGAEKQGCVIVNLRRHAKKMYELLEAIRPGEVFFLSSDLCPSHRSRVLQQVRKRLSNKEPCLLVSTQCIEAGVDVDFPVLYRALAPLESIIQAAGRCNRSGQLASGRVIVFLPAESGRLYPDDNYAKGAGCVLTLLSRHPIDCDDPTHIREYYELLYAYTNGDKKALKNAIEEENFSDVEKSYKIIDRHGVQVIVPDSGEYRLYQAVCQRYDREGLTAGLIKQAQPITVSSLQADAVRELCEAMYTKNAPEECGWFLLGNPSYYDSNTGLSLQLERFDGIV